MEEENKNLEETPKVEKQQLVIEQNPEISKKKKPVLLILILCLILCAIIVVLVVLKPFDKSADKEKEGNNRCNE